MTRGAMSAQSRRAIGPCTASRWRAVTISTSEMFAGDADEAPCVPDFGNQIKRQMPPAHALQNELSLHELISHRPAARASTR
jgi:hypothetical protein